MEALVVGEVSVTKSMCNRVKCVSEQCKLLKLYLLQWIHLMVYPMKQIRMRTSQLNLMTLEPPEISCAVASLI